MKQTFTINTRAAQRIVCTMLAALLVVAGMPFLQQGRASASTQLADRSIQLSDSAPSGTTITTGVGSGTSVTYKVSFKAFNNAASIILDFCPASPIINDPCTAPTGMNVSSATLTNITGAVGAAGFGWTITGTGGNHIKISHSDGNAAHDITAGDQVFEIGGITNPSSVAPQGTTLPAGTFYARIYTYADSAASGYVSVTNTGPSSGPTAIVDYGGIALATASTVTISARVQEQLSYCVTGAPQTTWASHDCSDPIVGSTLPSMKIGHGSTTNPYLDDQQVDASTVYTQLSTNATHGAIINMRNSNLTCGGLSADGGSTCLIPPVAAGAAVAGGSPITAGTAAFGLSVGVGTKDNAVTSKGQIDPDPRYYSAAHVTQVINPANNASVNPDLYFGMDTTTSTGPKPATGPFSPYTYDGSVIGSYGSTIASSPGPTYRINQFLTFAAAAALTTPAGIYTANVTLVATGTF